MTKLLGGTTLLSCTGKVQVKAVYNIFEDWNIVDCVKCMCFDSTARNIGLRAGCCTVLEQNL